MTPDTPAQHGGLQAEAVTRLARIAAGGKRKRRSVPRRPRQGEEGFAPRVR